VINIIRTGLDASNKEISTISHNLANGSTIGFKKSSAGFTDIYSQQVELKDNIDVGLGTRFVGTQRNHQQGSFIQTNGALDIAINGNGFFLAKSIDGSISYTRDGSLTMDSEGNVISSKGDKILSENGSDLKIPFQVKNEKGEIESLAEVRIDENGAVNSIYSNGSATVVGNVGLAVFANETGLKEVGMNQYKPTPMSGAAKIGIAGENNFGRIQSGALEASNTDATAEMAKMIKAQQAFSGSSRMLQAEADITKRLMG
jgi:flagellar hook protein FlgE